MQKLLTKIFILLLMTTPIVACNSILKTLHLDDSPELVDQTEVAKNSYEVLMSDGETTTVQIILLGDDADDIKENDYSHNLNIDKEIKNNPSSNLNIDKEIKNNLSSNLNTKKYTDKTLEGKIKKFISESKNLIGAYINVTVFKKQVLLTGSLPLHELSIYIETKLLQKFPFIKLNNELIITNKKTKFDHSQDSAINALILINFQEQTVFNPKNIKIITANRVVYLMGLVKKSQAKFIKDSIKRSAGVKQVVDLFEPL